MEIDIFDGVWNDGFIELHTGELLTDKNSGGYMPNIPMQFFLILLL